jgi:hypothetical protein
MEVLYTFSIVHCEVKPVEKRVVNCRQRGRTRHFGSCTLKSVLAPESIDLTHGSYVVMDGSIMRI